MLGDPIIIEQILTVPVESVWKAITDSQQMDKWYFKMAGFKASPGAEFTFIGTGSNGEKYVHICQIVEVIPLKKISYSWRYESLPGNSLVSFELYPIGDHTHIKLAHSGVESFVTDNPDFSKQSFTAGWHEIIGKNLPKFLEVHSQES